MSRPLLATFAVLAALAPAATAQQSSDAAVLEPVTRLFDGMRKGDSSMVRSVFDSTARLVTVGTRDGQPVVRVETVDGFVQAIGTPHDEVWDERLHDTEVRVDGNLAAVWTGYRFYLGDKFSHCGVDAFQLVRRADGWKISQIADTRRKEGC